MDAGEGSGRAPAAKQLAKRSGSKAASGPSSGWQLGRRARSSSVDFITVPAAAPGGGCSPAAALSRSYSVAGEGSIVIASTCDGSGGLVVSVVGGERQQEGAAARGGGAAGPARPERGRGRKEHRGAAGRSGGAVARLARKLKEHRTRFYIARRCVMELICWRDEE